MIIIMKREANKNDIKQIIKSTGVQRTYVLKIDGRNIIVAK